MTEKNSTMDIDVSRERVEEIEKLVYTCRDMRYMGIRLTRDCGNCIKKYMNSNDVLLLCNLSSDILQRYSGYLKEYVQSVIDSVNKLNKEDNLIEVLHKLNSITFDTCNLPHISNINTPIVGERMLAEHEVANKQTQTLSFNDSNTEIAANCSSDFESIDFDRETVVNFPCNSDLNDLSEVDDELNDDINTPINTVNCVNPVLCSDCNNQNEANTGTENINEKLLENDSNVIRNLSNNEETDTFLCTSSESDTNSVLEISKSNQIVIDRTMQEPDQKSALLCWTSEKSADSISTENSLILDNIIKASPPRDNIINSRIETEKREVNDDCDNYLETDKSTQCVGSTGLNQVSEDSSRVQRDNCAESSTSESSDRTVSNLEVGEIEERNDSQNELEQDDLENDSDNFMDYKCDSDSGVLDNEIDDEKLDDNKKNNNFKLDGVDRDRLLNLLIEDSIKRKRNLSSEDKATKPMIETKEELCDDNSYSELYDVIREEIVSNTLSKNSCEIKAQEAFKTLMEDEDEISGSDVDELKDADLEDDSDLNAYTEGLSLIPKMAYSEEYSRIKKEFGISKELVIYLPRYNNSISPIQEDSVDCSRSTSLSESSIGSVEKLCNLSTVLLGKRQKFMNRHCAKSKRPKLLDNASSDSSSLSWSDVSNNELCEDYVSLSPTWEHQIDDDQEAVNALWDDICNSSDDALDYEESTDESAGEKERVVVKPTNSVNRSAGTTPNSSDKDGKKLGKHSDSWRHDPLLHGSLSSDSDVSSDDGARGKRRKARERVKKRLRMVSLSTDDSSNDSNVSTFSSKSLTIISDNKEVESEDVGESKGEEDTPNKKSKGRRNIRALMKDDDLSLSTKQAREEEKLRIRRLQEKQSSQLNCSLSSECDSSPNKATALVLDEHLDTRVEVNRLITQRLKPHQREGIQFMWDSCFESIVQLENGWKGSGCILAHCMGLGKTRQALALVHTLFVNNISNTKYILIVCPLSTVNSWQTENKLVQEKLRKDETVPLYAMQDIKSAGDRFKILRKWRRRGGMLVLGYEAFGSMTNDTKLDTWEQQDLCSKEEVLKALINPGPDLVICDEGHLLRNKQTQRNLSLSQVRTQRRIVLTGTPLQNNLLEYHCMVHFVKPNLLGTEREFKTNFVNPISNGQYEDSTSADILLMKQRTHVLHKLLDRVVQRFEDSELKQYLPKLVDQALFISLSEVQVRLYNAYLDQEESKRVERTADGNIKRSNFLADVGILDYLCTHPYTLIVAAKTRRTKIKEQDIVADNVPDHVIPRNDWWEDIMPSDVEDNPELGPKMLIVLDVLKQANAEQDKVLIFSQTHAELETLEHFVSKQLDYKKGVDYLRMDGTSLPEARTRMCARFNDVTNTTLRLFIMSTKVGGLGLTLTAANRVLIMSVNWNPSCDIQSVFRVFRFGQTKPVYVYRLIARDTMEERRYKRQVTKLAVSHRVVDKYQVRRHYNMNDFQEMYSVRPSFGDIRPLPNVPDDKILAKLVQKFSFLYKWHEHQKLLANQPEEDLNEQEKNAAWEEFNKKDDGQPEPVVQPVSAPDPLSSAYAPTSVHSDHNYARPRLIAQGQLNTRIADPIRQRHFKTRTTFTSQEQMRSQEYDHPRAPAINRPNSQVVAPELDSNVAAHMRTTYANNKSPLHLHRLPEDPLPFKIVKSRYQPNPYAIAQKDRV
ncbi:uncharacterized protein LOC143200458 isoform X1 [Rhynchophorus ferrugineus]|uniref:uncharacterized protein LOC143200458 isoform X1 n=1 Tax=Rhynchophorus ferrugineus TaxID=354439 RepID=UPI003FCDD307